MMEPKKALQLRENLDEMLQGLANDVDEVLTELKPGDFHEAINWGDLNCAGVGLVLRMGGEAFWLVEVEEASPSARDFCDEIASRLSAKWGRVYVETEW